MRWLYADGKFNELPVSSIDACRASLTVEDEFAIEAAADYAEDSLGCQQARLMYTAPKDLG